MVEEKRLDVEISLLVCDKLEVCVVGWVNYYYILCFVFLVKVYELKEVFEKEILKKLEEYEIDYVILVGYMWLIGLTLLEVYGGKIINIYLLLLLSFLGKDVVG